MSFKILIVDDAPFVRVLLKNIFLDYGVEPLECGTVKEALEIIKVEKIEIVFLDLVLPEMNGVQLIEEIKKINPKVRFVICSNIEKKLYNYKLNEADIIANITKPFSKKDIVEALKKSLQN